MKLLHSAPGKGYSASLPAANPAKIEKKNAFLKNKAGELLKTKGNGKKQTENKPKTKLPKLLKIKEGPKKQTENKPKNKAGHLIANTDSQKPNRKDSLRIFEVGIIVRTKES